MDCADCAVSDDCHGPNLSSLLSGQIRARRLAEQWPLKKVAEELGVSTATLSQWEKGKRFPSRDFLASLARYWRVNPSRLFCCNGSSSDRSAASHCPQAKARSSARGGKAGQKAGKGSRAKKHVPGSARRLARGVSGQGAR